jgi:hypothetical protein
MGNLSRNSGFSSTRCWRLCADALFPHSLPSLFLKNKYPLTRDFVGVHGLPYGQRTIRGSFPIGGQSNFLHPFIRPARSAT